MQKNYFDNSSSSTGTVNSSCASTIVNTSNKNNMDTINKIDELTNNSNKANQINYRNNKMIKNGMIKQQNLKGSDESSNLIEPFDHNYNENEFETEAESLINIHIASNLNENTFHLSPNQANFYSEQIENQFMINDAFNIKKVYLFFIIVHLSIRMLLFIFC